MYSVQQINTAYSNPLNMEYRSSDTVADFKILYSISVLSFIYFLSAKHTLLIVYACFSLSEFNLISDLEDQFKEEEKEAMTKTMEGYMTKTQDGYRSDTNEHIEKALEIVDLFHIPDITQDQIMLRAFPMSLTEPDETLYQAWERFKELLMRCPQHYLMDMQEVILFYKGLKVPTRQILDSKGAIPTMTAANAKLPFKPSSLTLEGKSRRCCYQKSRSLDQGFGNSNQANEQALADLGASVSVMPFSTYTNLGRGELAHTKLTVELAIRTVKHPKVPLILERPFLSTVDAKSDVFKRKITLRLRRNQVIDLEPTIKEGEVVDEHMMDRVESYEYVDANFFPLLSINVMSKRFYNSIKKDKVEYKKKRGNYNFGPLSLPDFTVVENMDAYRDEGMGDIIVGRPFLKKLVSKQTGLMG
ncbi:hypothetical protein Tco_1312152 [Tanacetum coccineum]